MRTKKQEAAENHSIGGLFSGNISADWFETKSLVTMIGISVIGTISLVMSCVLLVISAVWDIRARRIPNILVGTFCVFAFISLSATWFMGSSFLSAIVFPVFAAIAVLGFGLVLFYFRVMGGGDVKLMAAVGLVAGPNYAVPFVLWTAVLGGFVALTVLALHHLSAKKATTHSASPNGDKQPQPPSVPYGVAIAAAGLWICVLKIIEHAA